MTGPLTIPCEKCGSNEGSACLDYRLGFFRATLHPHRERISAYRHATRNGKCGCADGESVPRHLNATYEHPEAQA